MAGAKPLSDRQAARVASAEAFARQAELDGKVSSGEVAQQGDIRRRLRRIDGLAETEGIRVIRRAHWYQLWAPGEALLGVAHYDMKSKVLTVYGPPWARGRQPRASTRMIATRLPVELWDLVLGSLGVTRKDDETTPVQALRRWEAKQKPVVWPAHDDEHCHVEPCRTCAGDLTPQETP